MTILTHTLSFSSRWPASQVEKAQRELLGGNSTREALLLAVGRELRARHWEQQKAQAGIDLLPVGDFARYDHVLTTSLLLGNVPARHQNCFDGSVDIDTLFRIGCAVAHANRRTGGGSGNDQMV